VNGCNRHREDRIVLALDGKAPCFNLAGGFSCKHSP
jgi:hypothetical protein